MLQRRRADAAYALVLLLSLLAGAAGAEELRYGVFSYSDLCLERQSGDMAGSRITIFRTAEGDKVIFEGTEGALMWPLVGTAKVQSGSLSFEVSSEGDKVTFEGHFDAEAITGRLSNREKPVRLLRVRDFSRRTPECRED